MEWQQARSEIVRYRSNKSKTAKTSAIVAASIYLCAGAALIGYFRYRSYWIQFSWTNNSYEIAALFGSVLLLVASIDLFTWQRFGDAVALAGVALVWPQLWLAEFNRHSFSAWLIFNGSGSGSDLNRAFLIASLSVLAVASMVFATVFSVLRLIPSGWAISSGLLRNRGWPGALISLCCIAFWYLVSVTPYRTPTISDGVRSELFLWHVQRHGLQFHETSIAFFRDGKFYIAHNDRRLLEYRFLDDTTQGVLTADSIQLFRRIETAASSFPGTSGSPHLPLHVWKTDYWFVAVLDRHTGKQVKAVIPVLPKDMLALSDETLKLPYERRYEEILRDVCFGFCYGPPL